MPGGETFGAAALAAQPGQLPAHRAVAQRHHLVGDAGAAQALGAHDAAGAAGTIHHHQCLRVGCEVADAVDQFAAGHADPFRDRHAGELLQRAAVQHDHVAAGVDPRFQLGWIDAFGAVVVLGPLAERLGRHVDPAEQHLARRRPGLGAAVQDRDVRAPVGFQPGGQALGHAAPIIGADDARAAARQQGARPQLGLGQRAGDGPKQVRGTEFTLLAGIQQREFGPIGDPATQGGGVDAVHASTLGVCGSAWQRRRRGAIGVFPGGAMDSEMQVFDRAAVRRHRDRAAGTVGGVADVLRDAAERLLDRLDDTTRGFTHALDVGGRGVVAPLLRARGIAVVSCDLSPAMAACNGGPAVAADEEFLPFAPAAST